MNENECFGPRVRCLFAQELFAHARMHCIKAIPVKDISSLLLGRTLAQIRHHPRRVSAEHKMYTLSPVALICVMLFNFLIKAGEAGNRPYFG